jgi:hypothetical protein
MAEVADTGKDKFLKRISHDGHMGEKSLAEPLPWELPRVIEPIRPRSHTFQWHSPDS